MDILKLPITRVLQIVKLYVGADRQHIAISFGSLRIRTLLNIRITYLQNVLTKEGKFSIKSEDFLNTQAIGEYLLSIPMLPQYLDSIY